MSPRFRLQLAGGMYHVTARGCDRRRIFVDEKDYATYIRLLGLVVVRQGWRLLCFCLMPNHVHLLIETPEPNLANGMQWLHSRYALYFNERHARKGHLFEAPYKSPMVVTDAALVRAVAYIVENPVDAVLCDSAADWPWGSHAALHSHDGAPSWLAHGSLLDRLAAATGAPNYERLIATWERALAAERLAARRQRPPAA